MTSPLGSFSGTFPASFPAPGLPMIGQYTIDGTSRPMIEMPA
ncbi:MAG: hypothetical protein ACRDQA_03805 [Nocardioidaceae bacterium]